MFTGIIQHLGIVTSRVAMGKGIRFGIDVGKVNSRLEIGSSIAINGVCLTVTRKIKSKIEVEAVEETLKKTTLQHLRPKEKVNCEPSLLATDSLGGHFVLGHIDCIGKVSSIEKKTASRLFTIEYPSEFALYVIPRGSIAIDGVSLTVADIRTHRDKNKSAFLISIIPHTFENTNFHFLKKGTSVNIEFDMVGKYIVEVVKKVLPTLSN